MHLDHPSLRSERTVLRMATKDDIPSIIRYFADNELHLAKSGPLWVRGYLTEAHWQKQIDLNDDDYRCDRALRMFVFDVDDRTIIGSVNLNAILRGAAHFCYLGYGINRNHQGKGLMFETLTVGINFAFSELNLHRIMANYMPTNRRSGDVLRRLGFVEEGFAKDYLFLNGRWCDHVMTSLTNKNWHHKDSGKSLSVSRRSNA